MTKQNEGELKACPCCGSSAGCVVTVKGLARIECSNKDECSLRSADFFFVDDAIEAWNTRVNEPLIQVIENSETSNIED